MDTEKLREIQDQVYAAQEWLDKGRPEEAGYCLTAARALLHETLGDYG